MIIRGRNLAVFCFMGGSIALRTLFVKLWDETPVLQPKADRRNWSF